MNKEQINILKNFELKSTFKFGKELIERKNKFKSISSGSFRFGVPGVEHKIEYGDFRLRINEYTPENMHIEIRFINDFRVCGENIRFGSSKDTGVICFEEIMEVLKYGIYINKENIGCLQISIHLDLEDWEVIKRIGKIKRSTHLMGYYEDKHNEKYIYGFRTYR